MAAAITIGDRADCKIWITMVHGMSQDHRVFDRQVAAFRDRFNLLLVDLPGHGLASEVGGPYGHDEFTRYVEAAINENGVKQTHYWGTHTGATVGLLLAARCPEVVMSLILEGPVIPGNNPPVVKKHMENARRAIRNEGVDAARSVWWSESCWFDQMRSDPVRYRANEHRAIVDVFSGKPWLDDTIPAPVDASLIGNIAQPTLIYNGAHDHPDFIEASDAIAEIVPQATKIQIVDAGGFPAWEQPDSVNERVLSFIHSLPKE